MSPRLTVCAFSDAILHRSAMSPPVQQILLLLLLLLFLAGTCGSLAVSNPVHNPVEVHKCCSKNYAYDESYMKCRMINQYDSVTYHKFRVPKYISANGDFVPYKTEEISINYEKLKCPKDYYLLNKKDEYGFRVSEKGILEDQYGYRLDFLKLYCLEQHIQRDFKIVAFVCSPPKPKSQIMVCMIISLLFLVATFLVFAVNKELRNLHGMFIMCYTATLFVAYVSCIAIHIYIGKILEKNVTCTSLSFLQHFCFLTSFLWFTAMSFELWWSFNLYKPPNSKNDTKKLAKYSIYVWGFAFVIPLFTLFTKSALSNVPDRQFNIEYYDCWFSSFQYKMLWYYFPINTVLLINFYLNLHTSITMIYQVSKSKKLAVVRYFKDKCMTFLKLFVVMGVSLEIEMWSWAKIYENDKIVRMYQIQDAWTGLQGVFIFIIFVCNNRVLKLLNRKYFLRNGV